MPAPIIIRDVHNLHRERWMNNLYEALYETWYGKPVILELAAADLRVDIRGVILSEAGDRVRFRVGDAWDIDVFKSMILEIEEDICANVAR